ncbi:hypothetical protein GOP47_0007710 [Adiantum capillus-veneris]|uniref:Large ribosomal subunit protein uL6c n=1 Tax=Adiantum capillus-veneris TaxID=13818 RepID=A0A9D4V1V9_ADICA|nr:hypothetical protein GOP47_0007710 [Adiantum capillus-veneris]
MANLLSCTLPAAAPSCELRSSFIGEEFSLSTAEFKPRAQNGGLLRIECKESRIGKKPVTVLKGVSVNLDNQTLFVKGPLGELETTYPREIKVECDASGVITISRALDTRRARQMHGLFRTLTDNMIVGVSQGFEKKLQLIGVGYRAALEKTDLVMNLGFSHQVRIPIPEGIKVKVEENTKVSVMGRDKCAVGDFSASIRKWRPPEPYKGKGIKYADEVIRRKEGKAGKKK